MSLELIKSIRSQTGLPLKDIKKAVEEIGSDEQKIIDHLRKQGILKQKSRQDRSTNQGGVFAYTHDNRIGAMIELKCETDFVSRSDIFKELGMDLALHITAFNPKFVSRDQVDQDFINKELEIAREQLVNEGKPEDKIDMILKGKKSKIEGEFSLLSQPFLKDSSKSVEDHIASVVQTTGEKIVVSRFVVFHLA
ncbi:elongation factor Ts [Candidatus Gracilibacteria bacterium]|nr:elongation factor Ts [Candidatus Gracilibacteria bacterium]